MQGCRLLTSGFSFSGSSGMRLSRVDFSGRGITCSLRPLPRRLEPTLTGSDPDHLDPGNGVVVVVLGDDRDPLGNCSGSHEHVQDRGPATTGAQDGGYAGELARYLGVHW